MGKTVRNARGVAVDFDLIKIKEQMAALPTNSEVRARQNFIEKKLRRRLKKAAAEKAASEVKVQPILPGTEENKDVALQQEPSIAEVPLEPVKTTPSEKKSSRQKARSK